MAENKKPLEPEKDSNNILRINFDKEDIKIAEKYQEKIIASLKEFKNQKDNKFIKFKTNNLNIA